PRAQVVNCGGERAFRRMLFLGEGAYAVHFGSVRTPGDLAVDLRSLCGPWAAALGAWRALTRVSIPLEAVLCPDLRTLLAQISQLPEEVEPVCGCLTASGRCARWFWSPPFRRRWCSRSPTVSM